MYDVLVRFRNHSESSWNIFHRYITHFNSCTNRPDVSQCLIVQTFMDRLSNDKLSSLIMTQVTGESKPRSVVNSSMHPHLGNWMAIRRAVV